MLPNRVVRREARGPGQHTIPRGRDLAARKRWPGAEGATAPETLRQKDRDRVMNFWKAAAHTVRPTEGVIRRFREGAAGEISQVR